MRRWLRLLWVILALPVLAASLSLRQQRARTEREEALLAAVEQHQPALVEQLLAQGVSPTAQTMLGFSVVHRAVAVNDRQVLGLLLAAGADPDTNDASGNTPLMEAVIRGRVELARDLVSRGADVNHAGCWGWTPLHCAAQHGRTEMARFLLAVGARPSPRRRDRVTPLHLAAELGYRETARILVAHGSDVNARSRDGRTPLLAAALHQELVLARLLRASGADPSAPSRQFPGGRMALTASGSFRKPLATRPLLRLARGDSRARQAPAPRAQPSVRPLVLFAQAAPPVVDAPPVWLVATPSREGPPLTMVRVSPPHGDAGAGEPPASIRLHLIRAEPAAR